MRARGLIGQLGLSEWWSKALTKGEQKHIVEKFGSDLIKGNPVTNNQPKSIFLVSLFTWVSTKNEYPIALKIMKKAEEEFDTSMPVKEKLYYYTRLIEFYYKNREKGGCLDAAIKYCKTQISLSKEYIKTFTPRYAGETIGYHSGYKQLTIYEEKAKNYQTVIDLCKQAKEEGWAGDWDKRIERCAKKLGSSKS